MIIGFFGSLLVLGLVLGLVCFALGRKASLPKSAPRGNRTSRIAEMLILSSACLVVFVIIGCLSRDGRLLSLDQLRPAYAATHVIIACCIVGGLVLSVLLSLLGRTSAAVVLAFVALSCYSITIQGSHFGPGYLMQRLAPGDSYEPIVTYTFELNDNVQGADLWVNDVYLGKTPIKMTGREFHKKVPFMSKPPEGYADKPVRDRQWFIILLRVLEAETHGNSSLWYADKHKDYYARARLQDEWLKFTYAHCHNRSTSRLRRDFVVKLPSRFPSREKMRGQRSRRFENLLQKARLSDYKVGPSWFEAAETHGQSGWTRLRRLAANDKGFGQVVDKWVEWKYGVTGDISRDRTAEVFERICQELNAGRRYDAADPAGRAVELIFYRLDLRKLVQVYEQAIRSGRYMQLQWKLRNVYRHLMELWDARLDEQGDKQGNVIEDRIVPALICWRSDIEAAVKFGGPQVERYLLRQYRHENHLSGLELDWKDRELHGDLHLNKWLNLLAQLDSDAGRAFRARYRHQVLQLADLLLNSRFNDDVDAPEFLFLDLNRGKKSMAYESWPKYAAAVRSSSLWEYRKLEKLWAYLARLQPPPTKDMYMDCWRQVTDLHELMGPDRLAGALDAIARQMRVPVAKAIIRELEKKIEARRKKLEPERAERARFPEHSYVEALKRHVAALGDEESLQWLISALESGANKNYHIDQISKLLASEKGRDHPLLRVLAEAKSAKVRLLVMPALRRYPTPANREILHKLLNDEDEQVHRAAEEVAAELARIEEIPVEQLVFEVKVAMSDVGQNR
jgi:hypothetical protein